MCEENSGKYIWNPSILVQNFMTPIPLIPEKVVKLSSCLAAVYIIFFEPSLGACAVYTPRGSMDYENPETHEK